VAVAAERAFSVICRGGVADRVAAQWNAVELYTDARAPTGTVLEIAKTRRTEEETATRPDGSETRRDVVRVSYARSCASSRARREIDFHGRGAAARPFGEADRVTVIYDPVQSIRARVVSFMDLWMPSAAAFGVVICSVAGTAVALVAARLGYLGFPASCPRGRFAAINQAHGPPARRRRIAAVAVHQIREIAPPTEARFHGGLRRAPPRPDRPAAQPDVLRASPCAGGR